MIRLQGRHILVTRPSPAGEVLCTHIRENGGVATHLPTIAFAPPKDLDQLQSALEKLGEQEWLIFISPQAVRASVASIRRLWPNLTPQVRFAAVGGGTAQALQEAGYVVSACPTAEWSSEGLLALPAFQSVKNTKIAIVRGEGGRELLTTTLTERGADILPVVAYQRVIPNIDTSQYIALIQQQPLDASVCGSYEAVQNLKIMLGEQGWPLIQQVPIIVMSERIKKLAEDLGFQTIWVALEASHETVIATLADHLERIGE